MLLQVLLLELSLSLSIGDFLTRRVWIHLLHVYEGNDIVQRIADLVSYRTQL